jgi:hypothetical protein
MLASCPGWKSGGSGEAAERGTRIHAIIEDFLAKSDKGLVFNDDEMAAADNAIRWFKDTIVPAHPGITWAYEKYVPGVIADTGGTADVAGVDDFDSTGQIVVLIDWKSGSKYYDAQTNEQGHVHAVNAAKFWGAKTVVFYFYNCDTQQSSCATFTESDLARLESEIEQRIIMADTAERTGHGLKRFYGCNWCGRKLECREYRKDIDHAVTLPITTVAALTPQEVGEALDRYSEPANKIAEFIKALRAKAIADGAVGYKVGEKAGPRQWTNDLAAPSIEEAYEVDLMDYVSPAEAERRLKKKGIDTAVLSEYTVQPTHKTLTKDKA